MNPWERYQKPVVQQGSPKPWESYQAQSGITQPAQTDGFFDRVSQDYEKRKQMVAEANAAQQRGEQGAAQTFIQGFGKGGVGFVNDVIGQGIVSAGRGLSALTPDIIENPIKKGSSNVYNTINASPAGDIARSVQKSYSNFAQNNPSAARTIEGLANIGMAGAPFVPVKGVSAANIIADTTGSVVKTATSGIKAGKTAITNVTKKIAPDISPELARKMGGQALERAKQSGAVLPAERTNKFVESINATIKPTSEWAIAARESTPIDTMLKNFEELRNKPMTLDDAMQLDSQLGAFAHSPQNFINGKYSAAGTDALKIKNQLSNMIENADEFIPESVLNDWKIGKKQWSASIRANKINNIIDNAQYFDHPATSIRTGMRSIVKNKNEFSKYSPEEQFAIRKAADTGVVTDVLRLGASGLGPILSSAIGGATGGAIAGPVGSLIGSALAGAPAMAVREGAKSIATARQTARATNALNTVLSKGAGLPTEKLTMKQIMKLPPEQAKFYLQNKDKVK